MYVYVNVCEFTLLVKLLTLKHKCTLLVKLLTLKQHCDDTVCGYEAYVTNSTLSGLLNPYKTPYILANWHRSWQIYCMYVPFQQH